MYASCTVLDLPHLASGTFGLLHLPKMPELKGQDLSGFIAHPLALEEVPYTKEISKHQTAAERERKGGCGLVGLFFVHSSVIS